MISSPTNLSPEDDSFIQRDPHDEDNHYTKISNSLLRNGTLSPFCRWLIAYLLTFDKKWKIQIPYICKSQNLSKDLIYKYLNEAIATGYIKRYEYTDKGLKRYKYFISESPKFKDCLPCLEKPYTEKPYTENPDSKNKQEKEQSTIRKEINKEAPSYDGLTNFLLEKIKKINPDFSDSTKSWDKNWKMLLIKRDEKRLKEAIEWVFASPFWAKIIVSPHGLNKNLSKIEAARIIENKNTQQFSPEADKILADIIYKATRPRDDIVLGSDYIEFIAGMASVALKYGEKRFRENCIIQLEKRKINIKEM
jgi:hypothetical protein